VVGMDSNEVMQRVQEIRGLTNIINQIVNNMQNSNIEKYNEAILAALITLEDLQYIRSILKQERHQVMNKKRKYYKNLIPVERKNGKLIYE
jgi:hypothetical protein